ncbi:PREDICTED: uncharacterized protein LOC105144288 [Acromyrmex echinatior]|uniref:uncharacterized protein LOC105144288 n=1 Tax=Acromyrmex echinatior TaxID=103372 RepID=UPI000580C8B0|nr:PREDICTED: uncharacterized protein LOC105144288 [Acromyrmex echinatior]
MEILPLIPLFLGLRINVLPFNRDLEYNYNVTKTITIFRDPLQVTQYTASITCHTEDSYNSLLCLLHDIDIISTLIFQSLNTTNEVAHEQYKTNDDWFVIKFNNNGLEKLFVNSTTEKKDLIKGIAFQFHIGNEITPKFTAKEKLAIGYCMTFFDVNATTYEYNSEKILENQIILLSHRSSYEKTPLYEAHERHVHIRIKKVRKDCQYSLPFFDFLNGMKVSKYIHTMEIIDDKLNISTIMEVQLPPDPWNPEGTPVFREITQLKLIKITSPRTKVFDDLVRNKYEWIDLLK